MPDVKETWPWVAGKLAKGLTVEAVSGEETIPVTGKRTLKHALEKFAGRGMTFRAGEETLDFPVEEPKEAGNPTMADVHVPSTRQRRDMRMLKADTVQQKVLGVVFEPDVVDTQGDLVAAEEIEKACHQFLADYRAGTTELWFNHDTPLTDDDAVLVENYTLPVDAEIGGQPVKAGAWVQGWHIKSASLWQAVVDGTLTGFSFGGTGMRGPMKKKAGPPITFERTDGLVDVVSTPKGAFRILRDEHGRALGMEPA